MIDYSADVQAPKGPDAELLILVEEWEAARLEEERTQQAAEVAKKNRRRLEEVEIPEKLAALGIVGNGSTINLQNGLTIKLSSQDYVSIPADQKAAAYQWLRDNGFGAMVKEETKETVSVAALRPMSEDLPDGLFKVYTIKKVKTK